MCLLTFSLSASQNIARKTKRSRPPNLKDLLLLAVNRMMFQGVSLHIIILLLKYICCLYCFMLCVCCFQTEIFQKPVPPDIMTHYKEYIFHPMDLGRIKEVKYLPLSLSLFLSPLPSPPLVQQICIHSCHLIA